MDNPGIPWLEGCFLVLPRCKLYPPFPQHPPLTIGPISWAFCAPYPSLKRPRAGQPSDGAQGLPGWGPSHFPFHILGICFSSASLVPHLGRRLPLRHSLFHSYPILSSQARPTLNSPHLDGVSRPDLGPPSALRICMLPTDSFPIWLATGITKHPQWETRRIRDLNTSQAPHLGTQCCLTVNHQGSQHGQTGRFGSRREYPLRPVLVQPQDQRRHHKLDTK